MTARSVGLVVALFLLVGCNDEVRRTYLPNGEVWSEVRFENGRPNGPCTVRHVNGIKAREGDYLDGHRHGTWRQWTEEGVLIQENEYVLGEISGASRAWYANGQPKSLGEYVDGVPSGAWIEYFDDGTVSIRGTYADGHREGTWRGWNRDGSTKGAALFERGRFVRRIGSETPREDV